MAFAVSDFFTAADWLYALDASAAATNDTVSVNLESIPDSWRVTFYRRARIGDSDESRGFTT